MNGREDKHTEWITRFAEAIRNRDALLAQVRARFAGARRTQGPADKVEAERIWIAFAEETTSFLFDLWRTMALDARWRYNPAEHVAIADWASRQTRLLMDMGMTFDACWEMVKGVRRAIGAVLAELWNDNRFRETESPSALAEELLDPFEFGLFSSWMGGEIRHCHHQLREAHHLILLEKRRYHTVFQKIKEPAIVIDSEHKIIDVNRAFESFVDKRAGELRGENCCAVVGDKVRGAHDLEHVLAAKASFTDIEIDFFINGQKRHVVLAGAYLGLINGRYAGWIVLFQDVTEKRRMEIELRESEEKYRSLIQNMPDVTWRSDEKGHIVFISPNVEKVTGFLPEEISGCGRNGWFTRIHPIDLETVSKEIGLLFSRGRQLDIKYRFLRKEGTWIWLNERSGVAYIKDGIRMADGLLTDITRMREIEEELAQHHLRLAEQVDMRTAELRNANIILQEQISERLRIEDELIRLTEKLKTSNVELEQFAHVASHDLKEPLLLIIAFSERLLNRCTDDLDAKGLEYLRRILRAANQMQLLIEDLLQLSRVTAKERPFEKIDLSELVRELVQHLEERVNQEHAEIRIHQLHELHGDRVQVWQLFLNIINNALKYRKDAEPPVVTIRSQAIKDGFVEITVEDNGIGFEEKYLETIFTPFKRLHSQGKYEGTGIGLATCKKIVLRHGGEITARSKLGVGSTFIIRLPIMESRQTGAGKSEES